MKDLSEIPMELVCYQEYPPVLKTECSGHDGIIRWSRIMPGLLIIGSMIILASILIFMVLAGGRVI